MRIKTSGALRQVDSWREKVSIRYNRYVNGLYFLLIAVGFGRQLLFPTVLTLGLSLHFAFAEFGSLVVLGCLLLRLQSYRFANRFLRAVARVVHLPRIEATPA